MTTDRIARDYLRRARARRKMIDTLLAAGVYADVVRESQDAIELVLKGALRFVGVEPPKRHDVHGVVEQFIERFPPEWRAAFADLRDTLGQLAADRAPAFYGDEARTFPRLICSGRWTPSVRWAPSTVFSTSTRGCSVRAGRSRPCRA
jgi:hypothetical protein